MTPVARVPRRSLILAGGGIKVAFQAGALQVLLDEAGLTFDHVDAASGGVFNAAMLCQGLTGTQIADNWRNLNPGSGVHFNPAIFTKLLHAESLFTLDLYRKHIFTQWGLDWTKIKASTREATFNVYNFTDHRLEVLEPSVMSEDHLVAGVSLPMWFPPVRIQDKTYIDAVFVTDGNLEEAIRRGAEELWIIWTVSDKGDWRNGFVAQYFQIIEACAVGRYRDILARIDANNAALAAGRSGEFGRPLLVRELKADVPLHYLIDFSQDRLAEAVNLGVHRARAWCKEFNIPLQPSSQPYPVEVHAAQTRLWFTEEMKGFWTPGEVDPAQAEVRGREAGMRLSFLVTITVDGVNRFITDPAHEATITGVIHCDALGGARPIEMGSFNLFVEDADAAIKRMRYRLFFHDEAARPLTLSGHKLIHDDPGHDAWRDTTTLFVHLLHGHVDLAVEEAAAKRPDDWSKLVFGAGIVQIHLFDFLKQLTTFRTAGPTFADRAAAMTRFGKLFLGKLWDVYARDILSSTPL